MRRTSRRGASALSPSHYSLKLSRLSSHPGIGKDARAEWMQKMMEGWRRLVCLLTEFIAVQNHARLLPPPHPAPRCHNVAPHFSFSLSSLKLSPHLTSGSLTLHSPPVLPPLSPSFPVILSRPSSAPQNNAPETEETVRVFAPEGEKGFKDILAKVTGCKDVEFMSNGTDVEASSRGASRRPKPAPGVVGAQGGASVAPVDDGKAGSGQAQLI